MTMQQPVRVPPEAQRIEEFFLGRQPILDRQQSLAAYELLFRRTMHGPAGVSDDLSATASVILNTSELGVEHVVGGAMGFINVDAELLMSDVVTFLPPEKVVLEILESVRVTPELMRRIAELEKAGYTFALDDVVSETFDIDRLLPHVGIVKIDIAGMAPSELARLSARFRARNKRILAEKVETHAQFQECIDLGFDYFQGYYFAKPTILSGKKLSPSQLTVLELMGLLASDADTRIIEECIKRNASLGLALLRMVNTPAVGYVRRIESLSQALAVLGRQQLQRWLQILLYAEPGRAGPMVSPLFALATTRGRLLELIAQRVKPGDRLASEAAFTVGIMSLMDALFGATMDSILDKIPVREEVRCALLDRSGFLGEMLAMVECMERSDGACAAMDAYADKWQLSRDDLNQAQLGAFRWSEDVSRPA